MKFGTLVNAKVLKEAMAKPLQKLRVVDATWFLPSFGRTGIDNYVQGHIPGAVFFDIDACITPTDYEHMLPPESVFADYVGNLGIDNDTHVVVYNDHPSFSVFSAPRVWWTFRAFGHESVSILDGGLRSWKDSKFEIATEKETAPVAKFNAKFNPSFVKSFEDIKNNMDTKKFQLIDARPAGRFEGTDPEPRKDCKPGHIPGAVNIPFPMTQDIYTSPSGEEIPKGLVKSPEELKKVFAAKGIDLTKPLAASCGSGVSACVLALAAYLCDKKDVSVYDGAWVEWYKRSTPQQRARCPE